MAIQPLEQTNPIQQALPPQGQWTYEDYRRLPEDGWRYEVIEGELHMNPAPGSAHQDASISLASEMRFYAKDHNLGKVFTAPIDVRLGDVASPVQPDILFIRAERLDIIQERWIDGAPDLIVEILSPGNWIDDRRTKYRLYALAGVREYWIIDPKKCEIDVYVLHEGSFAQVGNFGAGERVRSEVLAGFEIGVDEICVKRPV